MNPCCSVSSFRVRYGDQQNGFRAVVGGFHRKSESGQLGDHSSHICRWYIGCLREQLPQRSVIEIQVGAVVRAVLFFIQDEARNAIQFSDTYAVCVIMLPQLFGQIGERRPGRIIFIQAVCSVLIDYRAGSCYQKRKEQKGKQQQKGKECINGVSCRF